MSEWVSVLAVFWLLWALDGARLGPRRLFTFVVGVCGRRGARVTYGRLSVPGLSPLASRIVLADVPLALSPAGLSNQVVGACGRPVEQPPAVRAWRWEEVREVGVAGGWIFVNGARFCPDTRHVTAPELLALAQLTPVAREKKIRGLVARWFRVAALRRRQRVLAARTWFAVAANVVVLAVLATLAVYVAGDFSARLPSRWSHFAVGALPAVLLGLLALHVAAVASAWRAVRRLKPLGPEKRAANLLSALLLPPQALRLRALAGEGFFPATHPLAAVVAWGGAKARAEAAFDTLADLRWSLAPAVAPPPLADEIAGWFRTVLEAELVPLLRSAGLSTEALLAPPRADVRASCTYCPRCRDQFVAGPTACPHGIALRPLARE